MEKFDFKGITSLSEKINAAISPISKITNQLDVFSNNTASLNSLADSLRIKVPVIGINGFTGLTIDLPPGLGEVIKNLEILQNPYLKLFQDLNLKIFDNQLIERIQSINYWGELASATLSSTTISDISDIEQNLASDDLQLYAEEIESNLQEIYKNPIEIFNKIVVSIKFYIEENPSVKVTATFIAWFITTVLVPVIITILTSKYLESEDDKNNTVQIINQNYNATSKSRAITKSEIALKNLPRNNSKDMFVLNFGDEVEILRENKKWCFVIKINTVETGWVRKQNLKFFENE